ncbi:MAG: hypothetical protein JSR82_03845 [Verrucomicrobia bacterium]|nr:hypothetical protein [Verrucomicrobiota bacterium]
MKAVQILSVSVGLLASTGLVSAQQSSVFNPNLDHLGGPTSSLPTSRPLVVRDSQSRCLLPGATLTNAGYASSLRRDLREQVRQAESSTGPTTIVDTMVVTPPATALRDLTNASWSELWVVQRASGRVGYRIDFVGRGRGRGISFKAARVAVL